MKTLIIYDSVFGNTAKLAESVAQALGGRAIKAADFLPADLDGVELLIAASPTRAFAPMPTLKTLIKSLPAKSLVGVKTAAFDTRISLDDTDSRMLAFMAGRFGYASEKLLAMLHKKGAVAAGEPAGFIVGGNEGPLKPGEEERAITWANAL